MHFTILPATPKTAQATIRALLASDPSASLRGVYRDLSRVPTDFASHPRFEAVQGDLADPASYAAHLKGTDGVFHVQPPVYDPERDLVGYTTRVSEGVKAAVKEGGVKRLVVVSSMGAQYEGTGEIISNHVAEGILGDAAPEVVFVRCGYFMENWAAALETIPEAGFFFTTFTPTDLKLPHIAIKDIGQTCADELLATGTALKTSPHVFDLCSPRKLSSVDVHKAWEEAAGKTIEMKVIPKEGLAEFYGTVFPPAIAESYVEMNVALLPGGIIVEDPSPTGETRHGKTELVEVFKQLLGA
ncbi:hypothetical protein B0T18DRAFT_438763 [Schizothecium vesticola]|uniref:NAD(P)-binding domain-containing protein n=1 Tax=Schizothecium vesticola TaxID=314040 RepID=A0AA40EWW0_9PEZI|nr:hypothetical protein B0T18DRAFT_438763 [Schizothecium vesticola]